MRNLAGIKMNGMSWIVLTLLLGCGQVFGQTYGLYSNDTLGFASRYLGETIRLNLHLPETLPLSASTTTYPVTIVFDSQHEQVYPQIIRSFDLLTNEAQLPESIIIGVPFTMRNRMYRTSDQTMKGDSLSGIERMEKFVFDELIPYLRDAYKANDHIALIGHSRTGFLVNYLAFKRPNRVNLAVSLSSFFDEEVFSVETFHAFLTDRGENPTPFTYAYSAGTSLEEATYLSEFSQLDSMVATGPIPEQVRIIFRPTPHANHMTNYWVSVPPLLIEAYSAYNAILDTWLHGARASENGPQPIEQFRQDLERAGDALGLAMNPSITHIYSLASHFAFAKEDHRTAIDFFTLGLDYFPGYLDFYVEIIEFQKVLGDTAGINQWKEKLRRIVMESQDVDPSRKAELLAYLDSE